MQKFTHYIGIDWSGAKGKRHKGLAVACCDDAGQVTIVEPQMQEKHWSRMELAAWINQGCDLPVNSSSLIGIDSAYSLPFMDQGAYFPELQLKKATDVWHHIEDICPLDPDYYAGGFVDTYNDYLHLPFIGKGRKYQRRMRVAERLCIERSMGPCESVYHLIGPSQVGMSAFSVMRMLAWFMSLGHINIWPFHMRNENTNTLVEIYAALFAQLGGHKGKVRSRDQLDMILTNLNASFNSDIDEKNDHLMDAIITAAGLRFIASDPKYWKPIDMSAKVASSEGWIFGVE